MIILVLILYCSYHESYLAAEERCNEHGSYLADVLDQAENDFLKSVLRAVNPKDGTDYWYINTITTHIYNTP